MLDKITQAVLNFEGETEIPTKHNFSNEFKCPKSGYSTLCNTNNTDLYVWASDESSNALNPDRRICTLDEYMVQARKVKDYLNFYGFTFDTFDLEHYNSKLTMNTSKKKYWDGESEIQVGDICKYIDREYEVEYLTKRHYCILVSESLTLLVETKNLLPVPVKSKKDKMVDELMSKLSGYDSGFARITIEQLYDLNLLKEID